MNRLFSLLAVALGCAACMSADEPVALGSLSFEVRSSLIFTPDMLTRTSSKADAVTLSDYEVEFTRVVLSFKTMTIGKKGDDERCAYLGRGASSNVVFDAREGIVQTFNGIQPAACPDVGFVMGPPDGQTTLSGSVVPSDLTTLAAAPAAHALIEMVARPVQTSEGGRTYRIVLRFDSERTSSDFGGCGYFSYRGVEVVAGKRKTFDVQILPDTLLRQTLAGAASLSIEPFLLADRRGDDDGVVTMPELDALPLTRLNATGNAYRLQDDSRNGSFGDYVRRLFRSIIRFRTFGQCVGNDPDDL